MSSYLNVGCGQRFHREWTNLDRVPCDPSILQHDLCGGICFGDAEFDVVYHSHVLEHFSPMEGLQFLRECRRVLKPQGIIRIAVPNLQRIAEAYLSLVEKAVTDPERYGHDYDWTMLEMYDQTVREYSGGMMGEYLSQAVVPNLEFVLSRVGLEARRIIECSARLREQATRQAASPGSLQKFFRRVVKKLRRPSTLREVAVRRVLGPEYELLQVGRFRRGGEVHLWMYDRYSLGRLLLSAGFSNSCVRAADESAIANWASFHLDTEPDGSVYKPDSLFMEAVKP